MKIITLRMIIFILFMVMLSLSSIAIDIDLKVLDSLNENRTAEVIVVLIDDSNVDITGNSRFERVSQLKRRGKEYLNAQDKVLSKFTSNEFILGYQFEIVNGFSGIINRAGFEKVINNPELKSIRLSQKYVPELRESIPLINGGMAPLSYTGNGQTVCVIDSGIDYTHSAFGGCTPAQFLGGTCNKFVGGYNYYNNSRDPIDTQGHGTAVAGIVAAEGIIDGVSPNSKLAALKVCKSFPPPFQGLDCNEPAKIKAFEWCIKNSTLFDINVITMSLGSTKETSLCSASPGSIEESITNATNLSGISVIKSTGNNGWTNAVTDPGCVEDAYFDFDKIGFVEEN